MLILLGADVFVGTDKTMDTDMVVFALKGYKPQRITTNVFLDFHAQQTFSIEF